MKSGEKDRNDLVLLLPFLLIGIAMMLCAGQKATQLLPSWILRADIGSNLDPNNYLSVSDTGGLEPLRPEILTPPIWDDSFLTPGSGDPAGATPPTFVVFDPNVTPSPSASPTAPTVTVTATSTTPATPSVTATRTRRPPTSTPTAPPTATSVTSTLDPTLVELSPTPAGLNMGTPDGSNASGTGPGGFPDGSYMIIDVSSIPIVVNPTPDGNYDLVYYEDEYPNGSNLIAMDQVILGISNDSTGSTYYQVFNWGDGIPDANSNVNTTTLGLPAAEVDNQNISTTVLYQDPSSPPGPPNLQTGILIDVDQAACNPPPGVYNFLVVIAPPASNPNNASDGGHVDSIQVTEISSPAPP